MNLKDFWYIACESNDLKKAPLAVTLLNEWIVLFRDENGKASALQDACLHRNARLSEGAIKNGQLVCPYHGWTYDISGKVTSIPSEGPGFKVPEKWCIQRYQILEQEGYVYVKLGTQLEAKLETDAKFEKPFSIPYFGQAGFQHIRLKHIFQSSVPNCAENFIDIPHTSFVHPNIFRYQRAPQKLKAELMMKDGDVHVRYRDETSNFGVFSRFLNPTGQEIYHEDHYYFPNTTHVEYRFAARRIFNITSQSIPVGDRETHVYTDLTWDYGIWNLISRPFVKYAAKKIIGQDVNIMAKQNAVIGKYGERFLSSRCDLQHIWIERIYASLLAGKDPRELTPKTETMEFWI